MAGKATSFDIAELAGVRATLVLYESGPRLAASLAALAAGLGDREAAVGRELTKRFEETVTGTLTALADRYAGAAPRGWLRVWNAPTTSTRPSNSERSAAHRKARLLR